MSQLDNIVLLSRIALFAGRSARSLAIFNSVHSSWREAVVHYRGSAAFEPLLLEHRFCGCNTEHPNGARIVQRVVRYCSPDLVRVVMDILARACTATATTPPAKLTNLAAISPKCLRGINAVGANKLTLAELAVYNMKHKRSVRSAGNSNDDDGDALNEEEDDKTTAFGIVASTFPRVAFDQIDEHLDWTILNHAVFARNLSAVRFICDRATSAAADLEQSEGDDHSCFLFSCLFIEDRRAPLDGGIWSVKKRHGFVTSPTLSIACAAPATTEAEQREVVEIVRLLLAMRAREMMSNKKEQKVQQNQQKRKNDELHPLGKQASVDGTTPLHFACSTRNFPLIRYILDDVLKPLGEVRSALLARDVYGRQPVHMLFPPADTPLSRKSNKEPGSSSSCSIEEGTYRNLAPIVKELCEAHNLLELMNAAESMSRSLSDATLLLRFACRAFCNMERGAKEGAFDRDAYRCKDGRRGARTKAGVANVDAAVGTDLNQLHRRDAPWSVWIKEPRVDVHRRRFCHAAAEFCHETIVYLLNGQGCAKQLHSRRGPNGWTCLHIAVHGNSARLVETILRSVRSKVNEAAAVAPDRAMQNAVSLSALVKRDFRVRKKKFDEQQFRSISPFLMALDMCVLFTQNRAIFDLLVTLGEIDVGSALVSRKFSRIVGQPPRVQNRPTNLFHLAARRLTSDALEFLVAMCKIFAVPQAAINDAVMTRDSVTNGTILMTLVAFQTSFAPAPSPASYFALASAIPDPALREELLMATSDHNKLIPVAKLINTMQVARDDMPAKLRVMRLLLNEFAPDVQEKQLSVSLAPADMGRMGFRHKEAITVRELAATKMTMTCGVFGKQPSDTVLPNKYLVTY